jgi:hypothetical protein
MLSFWRTWVADKLGLASLAEALSRAVPDTDCRVILFYEFAMHKQRELAAIYGLRPPLQTPIQTADAGSGRL